MLMTQTNAPKTLEVAGGKIAYDVAGKGRDVILLHEGIADRRMWDREFKLLGRDHHVARYDYRGYGGSTPARSEFSPVGDLMALLDHLQMERPLIVGPSTGWEDRPRLDLGPPEEGRYLASDRTGLLGHGLRPRSRRQGNFRAG